MREFFSIPQYLKWSESEEGRANGWRTKYYKGLGTSTADEGRAYFSNLPLHRKAFFWSSEADGQDIHKAFAKSMVDARKTWLLEPKGRARDDSELFAKQKASFSEFINQELIEFSRADVERSIPSVVDGLKPSQRKVLFAAMKKGSGEIKVAQLGGYCAETTAYHHGEQSLFASIVKLAQDFVGSNNVPLLVPVGQFGTRTLS